ncbi:MAG: hypothetical protein ABI654_08745 [Betaproteobacteria bacterium]
MPVFITSILSLTAAFLTAALLASAASAGEEEAKAAGRLQAKYTELRGQLSDNPFQKPVVLVSGESQDSVAGDMYALVEQPFAATAAALSGAASWCEILFLHLNTKYCRPAAEGKFLHVSIGKKHEQPLDEAYRVAFAFRVAARTPDYLQVRLNADQGPLSTRDYRIMLEAVALDNGRTFIHLSYAYGFGAAGRLAMQVYLGTLGNNKVGFTVVGTQADGQRRYIGGMRGLVERNTMRYYLAIEAFLGALSAPPQAQLDKRLRDWFAATERYPRQLHEMEQGEYLEMKRREHQRQQAGLRPPESYPQENAHVQNPGTG